MEGGWRVEGKESGGWRVEGREGGGWRVGRVKSGE